MTKRNNTCYTVFSQRLMATLILKGFVLVDMRPDRKGSGRNVFYFNDTPRLRAVIQNYRKYN